MLRLSNGMQYDTRSSVLYEIMSKGFEEHQKGTRESNVDRMGICESTVSE